MPPWWGRSARARPLWLALLAHGLDALVRHPLLQLVEGERHIGVFRFVRLAFFGDARADEHRVRARILFPDALAVRLHGRQHMRQVAQHFRIIFLDQAVHRGAAAGDDHALLALAHHPLVFARNQFRAQRSFLRGGKAQPLQRFFHVLNAAHLEIGNEGRRDGGNHPLARADGGLHFVYIRANLLGVLRADHVALAAQDAFVRNDLRPVFREADGLHGANGGCTCSSLCNCFLLIE